MQLTAAVSAAPVALLLLLTGSAEAQIAAQRFDHDQTPTFRGQLGAHFAGWDAFTSAFGGLNPADDPASDLAATLEQLSPGAILTTTGNIYAPGLAPSYRIDVPVQGPVAQVVLQTRSLGTPLDPISFQAVVALGSGQVGVDPVSVELLAPVAAAEERIAVFALPPGSEGPLTLIFGGANPNCSLDAVMVDILGRIEIGSPYCTAEPNSTGGVGRLAAFGSDAAADNSFELRARGLPPRVFGLVIVARNQGSEPVGNSVGTLCLGGQIGRFSGAIFFSGNAGETALTVDLGALPLPSGLTPVAAGDTWNFQAWHRDVVGGVGTSNFTLPVSVTFS